MTACAMLFESDLPWLCHPINETCTCPGPSSTGLRLPRFSTGNSPHLIEIHPLQFGKSQDEGLLRTVLEPDA